MTYRADMMLGPVIVDVAGLSLTADDETLLREPWVGGIILFTRNYQSVAQLRELVAQIRVVRPELLICVDQEGGRVQRFRDGFTIIPPMADIGAAYQKNAETGVKLARACGWLMAAELRACGVDLSFAPVLDLDDERCAVIANRSFSLDPLVMSVLSEAFIDGMHEANMCATGKHFPGHGAVSGDSHHETPIDTRVLDTILAEDVMPYRNLCEQGKLDAVMPAHVVYSAVDKNPAGFSPFWLQEILKEQLRFDGVIFSDDLTMEGAGVIADMGERAHVALAAGCTALLVCNQRPAQLAVVEALKQSTLKPASNLQRLKRPFTWLDLDSLRKSGKWIENHHLLQQSLAL
ncbi:MAG TPA: beta-N-acetylhexosaminidase [Pseudomonadales bacterium]|nr:beta-N-acetylhexosaminidase [Pseudomonadales bacterium]